MKLPPLAALSGNGDRHARLGRGWWWLGGVAIALAALRVRSRKAAFGRGRAFADTEPMWRAD